MAEIIRGSAVATAVRGEEETAPDANMVASQEPEAPAAAPEVTPEPEAKAEPTVPEPTQEPAALATEPVDQIPEVSQDAIVKVLIDRALAAEGRVAELSRAAQEYEELRKVVQNFNQNEWPVIQRERQEAAHHAAEYASQKAELDYNRAWRQAHGEWKREAALAQQMGRDVPPPPDYNPEPYVERQRNAALQEQVANFPRTIEETVARVLAQHQNQTYQQLTQAQFEQHARAQEATFRTELATLGKTNPIVRNLANAIEYEWNKTGRQKSAADLAAMFTAQARAVAEASIGERAKAAQAMPKAMRGPSSAKRETKPLSQLIKDNNWDLDDLQRAQREGRT